MSDFQLNCACLAARNMSQSNSCVYLRSFLSLTCPNAVNANPATERLSTIARFVKLAQCLGVQVGGWQPLCNNQLSRLLSRNLGQKNFITGQKIVCIGSYSREEQYNESPRNCIGPRFSVRYYLSGNSIFIRRIKHYLYWY